MIDLISGNLKEYILNLMWLIKQSTTKKKKDHVQFDEKKGERSCINYAYQYIYKIYKPILVVFILPLYGRSYIFDHEH